MELKFELRSKTPAPGDTVNLKFLPVEGGPTGDLTIDGVPEAEAVDYSVPSADERLGVVRDGNGNVTEGQAKKPFQVFTVTVTPA
jgi:hypothetical protein